MTSPVWLASVFRADAVARLVALGTLAGGNVAANRPEPIEDRELPFIGVYTTQDNQTLRAEAGSTPEFDTSLQLAIEPRIGATTLDAATVALDTIIAEVIDGLMQDPAWVMQFSKISAIKITSKIDATGAYFIGLAMITFTLAYNSSYPPRLPGTTVSAVVTSTTTGGQVTNTSTVTLPTG